MSLILKNSVVFPIFKHQETLTFHRREQPTRTTKRFHTVVPVRRLVSQSTRPINLTHQGESIFERSPKEKQKTSITPRPTLQKDHSLQGYLDHLNFVRPLRSPLVGDATIKKIKEEVELFQTESQTVLQRFKSLKEQGDKRKKISLLETVRNPFAQQYKKFTEQLYNLIHNLHQLKDYLNNSRKLFQVVKNQIGTRKNLYRVLINTQTEELYEFSEISRLCCIRDVQFINGEQRVIEKFDLTLMDDLIYMTDSIKYLLQQNQLKAIERMRDNIKVEKSEIDKLRGQLGMREENHQLSIGSAAMQRFKPHLELENIESRLGQLNQIPKQARWTSQLLCDIVVAQQIQSEGKLKYIIFIKKLFLIYVINKWRVSINLIIILNNQLIKKYNFQGENSNGYNCRFIIKLGRQVKNLQQNILTQFVYQKHQNF